MRVVPTRRLVAAVVGAVLLTSGCSGAGDDAGERRPVSTTTTAPAMDDVVRMNEVQVIGTHNSYHRRLPPELFELLTQFDRKLAMSVDYEHRPIAEQLESGVRSLELDVFADPEGGRFASRAAKSLVNQPRASGLAELDEPGFKVLHLPEIDFESTCLSLRTCLGAIRSWSEANPMHLPVMVFVEAKDSPVPDVAGLGFATPVPIGAPELDALDAEIREVFDDDRLLAPDDVRGERATLREAVTTDGWPTLADSRGKVAFTLIGDEAKRDLYVAGHAALRGRAMFTLSGPDAPESAVISRPDATTATTDIEALARQGFLVRTRADADTVEARAGDTARRDAALASAATWISTDFPQADTTLGASGYVVQLPDGRRARCNPVLAPPACRDDQLVP